MTGLPAKTFQQFTNDMVAQWTAQLQAAGALPPGTAAALQQGDALFAQFQALASQLVFMQALAQLVNEVARAQTSEGADVDTFLAQFDFARLPAVAAGGVETFSRFTPATSPVTIAAGVVVQTVGGAIQYQVVADTTQPTWTPSQNAYVLPIGQSSLTATVQALQPGTTSNVAAGQLTQIGSPLAGIDTVTNAAPITNGINQESDAAALARFVLFLNSLSKATKAALQNAIAGVGQGIEFNLVENVNLSNVSQPGMFVAVVDDGTGNPPASLLAAVQAQIEVTRGFTILGIATAVTKETVTIVVTVRVAPTFVQSVVNGNVANAIALGVNATLIGGTADEGGGLDPFLHISDVEGFARSVAGVVSVQPGTTINSVAADFALTGFEAARTDVNHITVGNY